MEKRKCEKCGQEMQEYETENCMGVKCPNCGWGWVTTRSDPLFEDETIYQVKIPLNLSPSKPEITAVSEALGINYLQSLHTLKAGTGTLSGSTNQIMEKLKKLKANNVAFEISPNFPHEIL